MGKIIAQRRKFILSLFEKKEKEIVVTRRYTLKKDQQKKHFILPHRMVLKNKKGGPYTLTFENCYSPTSKKCPTNLSFCFKRLSIARQYYKIFEKLADIDGHAGFMLKGGKITPVLINNFEIGLKENPTYLEDIHFKPRLYGPVILNNFAV